MTTKTDTVTLNLANHGEFWTTLDQVNADNRSKPQLIKDCKDIFGDCFTTKELQAWSPFVLKVILNPIIH